MAGSFGARLRQRREEQAIDLIAIAAQTKIKLSLLEGLERDDVSHWPAGIFRRAYVRAYAQSIGLDPDRVVREFLEAHPEPEELVTTEAITAALDGGRPHGPPTRLRYIVGSALGSLSRLRRAAGEDSPTATRVPVNPTKPVSPEPIAQQIQLHHPIEDSVAVLAQQPLEILAEPAVDVRDAAPVEECVAPDATTVIEDGVVAHETIEDSPVGHPVPSGPELADVASLCVAFGRVADPEDVQPLLAEAAAMLDAAGMIVWIWDPSVAGLRAALAQGYSRRVLSQLPTLTGDEENATSAAFRSQQTCVMTGRHDVNGALAVPLLVSGGCAGVLAIEVLNGGEQRAPVRAVAIILAALLAQMVGAKPAEVHQLPDTPMPDVPMRIVRAGAGR